MSEKVKAPQDRKPKASKLGEATVNGITVTINADAISDYSFIRDLALIEDENDLIKLPGLLKRVFGDQMPEIEKALTDENGMLPVNKMFEFLGLAIGEAFPNS